MFKAIPLILIAIGIYIGVLYGDEITDVLGQDTINQLEEVVEETVENGKDNILENLKELND